MTVSVDHFATVAELARALGPDTRVLAGGTLVMRDVNYGQAGAARLAYTTDPALTEIRAEAGRIVLGAGVTMAAVIARPELSFLAPVARQIGGPAVRSMATVGGNLFAPHPYGDFATALLALDGVAEMADGAARPLADLLARRAARPGFVRAVSLARPQTGEFRFRKVSRVKPKGVSVMSMAAWLPGAAGRITGARVAYGAMAETPVRVAPVERALEGAALDAAAIARATAAATEGLNPPDDALASGWYRRETAPVHLRRLLEERAG
ncbi:MAG: FAD binding domain-containing protein [Pseudomonadota bacterium]